MKTSLALLLLLLAVPALCGEPPKAAPEDVGAQENALQRREKNAEHRKKMTALRGEFRAAKTPKERAEIQQRIQSLRRARQEQMRRSGRGGGDASASEGGVSGLGGGRGKGGGGGGGGRGDGSGGGRRAPKAAAPAPPANPETPATPAAPAAPAQPGKPGNPDGR